MFLTPCRVCHTRRSLRRAPARSRVGYCPRFCSLCMRDPSRHPPPTIASALFTAHSHRHRHPTPLPPTLPPSTLPNPAHITSSAQRQARKQRRGPALEAGDRSIRGRLHFLISPRWWLPCRWPPCRPRWRPCRPRCPRLRYPPRQARSAASTSPKALRPG